MAALLAALVCEMKTPAGETNAPSSAARESPSIPSFPSEWRATSSSVVRRRVFLTISLTNLKALDNLANSAFLHQALK